MAFPLGSQPVDLIMQRALLLCGISHQGEAIDSESR